MEVIDQWEEVAPQTGFTVAEREGRVEHKDIADILPSEDITINRSKGKVSPFVPILKTPNYAQNSGLQTGYSVEIQDLKAESGYRQVCPHVSTSYLLIPNQEIYDLGTRICEESGNPFKVSRIFWDGARFAVIYDFDSVSAEIEGEDRINLSLVIRNSYNKAWAAEASLMGKRFLCDNGVLSGEFFSRVRFKHTEGSRNWDELIEQGLGTLTTAQSSLEEVAGAMRRMRTVDADNAFMREVFSRQLPDIGPLNTGKILQEYWKGDDHSAYGLFNAGTNVFWHDKSFSANSFALNRALVDGMVRAVDNTN